MQSDVFVWHGYSSILLDQKWIKATPAFNLELCQRFGLKSLEFDGTEDSIYHPFDLEGRRHMEYLTLRGEYSDVPIAEIEESFRMEYKLSSSWNRADFEEEVKQETRQHLKGRKILNQRLVPPPNQKIFPVLLKFSFLVCNLKL